MPQRDANEVADLLEEIGRRAAFEGGNPYKAKAYVLAAASLRRLLRPLHEVIRQGALHSISGVGTAIAKRIEALHSGATDDSLARMRRKLPAGLLELLAIPGLKPQTITKLHALLGVNSLEDVAAACNRGEVAATKGLGFALERKVLQGIAIAREGEGRLRMNQAQAVLEQTIAELNGCGPSCESSPSPAICGGPASSCRICASLRLIRKYQR